MKTPEMGVIRFILGMTAVVVMAVGLAMACPKGKASSVSLRPSKRVRASVTACPESWTTQRRAQPQEDHDEHRQDLPEMHTASNFDLPLWQQEIL